MNAKESDLLRDCLRLVNAFDDFDRVHWYRVSTGGKTRKESGVAHVAGTVPGHERGIATVRHTLHHLHVSLARMVPGPDAPPQGNFHLIPGLAFEHACRLSETTDDNRAVFASELLEGFKRINDGYMPSGALGFNIGSYVAETAPLMECVVRVEDGEVVSIAQLREPVSRAIRFLTYVSAIAIAMHIQARHRYGRSADVSGGANSDARCRIWMEMAQGRLETLRSKVTKDTKSSADA